MVWSLATWEGLYRSSLLSFSLLTLETLNVPSNIQRRSEFGDVPGRCEDVSAFDQGADGVCSVANCLFPSGFSVGGTEQAEVFAQQCSKWHRCQWYVENPLAMRAMPLKSFQPDHWLSGHQYPEGFGREERMPSGRSLQNRCRRVYLPKTSRISNAFGETIWVIE